MTMTGADLPVVRPAVEGDLLGLVQLVDRVPSLRTEEVTTLQRRTWRRMLRTDDLTVYVADDRGEVVATTSLLVMAHLTYDCHPTAFIEPMLVAEPHRRRGIATRMLEAALHAARKASCRKVQIVSHKRHHHDGAIAFYRSAGFEAEAEGLRLYLDT